jgi:hypothetical protein
MRFGGQRIVPILVGVSGFCLTDFPGAFPAYLQEK